ncbi:MAG: hypothetical protein Q9P14_15030 [candidate division KSB1 bacterium]|nr:hypothetical protein [candidate division KSB1 bacterium]MDQ7065126.1 hypothetical protein [candidate division KSB1 bacterium]
MANRLARMHTAEHILSAIMRIHYAAPKNLELHLNEKKTKCDYQPAVPIDEAAIRRIEAMVNAEIRKNHPVTAFMLSRQEAEQRGYDLWKVPPDAEEIRIVKIGELDAQPCSGQHVTRTAEIGVFRIISHDVRESGRLRLRFRVMDTDANVPVSESVR